ncbi:hypothetical protein NL676_026001 [Syzygium grande]|nr:hypothetical protein NL676_026001 [Syzygium grande]
MTPLNKVLKKYLDYLKIETRSFGEKAWRRAERRIHCAGGDGGGGANCFSCSSDRGYGCASGDGGANCFSCSSSDRGYKCASGDGGTNCFSCSSSDRGYECAGGGDGANCFSFNRGYEQRSCRGLARAIFSPVEIFCSDKQMAMLALNQGIMWYLDYLNISTDEFNEKAWKLPNHQVDLVEIWVDRIYPSLDLLKTGNNAQ